MESKVSPSEVIHIFILKPSFLMTPATFPVILTGIQTTQGIIHKIIQSILDSAQTPKNLNSGIREFLLRTHAHASGNDVRDLVF